jgi:hypothetical protein
MHGAPPAGHSLVSAMIMPATTKTTIRAWMMSQKRGTKAA